MQVGASSDVLLGQQINNESCYLSLQRVDGDAICTKGTIQTFGIDGPGAFDLDTDDGSRVAWFSVISNAGFAWFSFAQAGVFQDFIPIRCDGLGLHDKACIIKKSSLLWSTSVINKEFI